MHDKKIQNNRVAIVRKINNLTNKNDSGYTKSISLFHAKTLLKILQSPNLNISQKHMGQEKALALIC